jgi:dTMP kinase
MRGRLVALEGLDGCGKTTQAVLLAERLGAELTFEPGATALGVSLRGILLHTGTAGVMGVEVSPMAEALLMAADRAQHVAEVVEPILERGRWVVTDRFSGSTLAYQGYGRGIALDQLRCLVEMASGGLWPDLTVLVDVSPDVARQRMGRSRLIEGSVPDRLERAGHGFADRVREGYLALAEADPLGWAVVDGGLDRESVAAGIWKAVCDRLGEPVVDA